MKSTKLPSRRRSASELGLFELQRVQEIRAELCDLLLHPREDVGDVLGLRDLLPNGLQDHLLCERPTDQGLVLARALGGERQP